MSITNKFPRSISNWCTVVALLVVLFSLFPQIHFWLVRGADWNGAFTVVQGDELLYSAYVNALVDGRPRRTDPASGRDDHPSAPLAESLFSIQFVPPYLIAVATRLLGLTTSTAFICLLAIQGLLASVAIAWLLTSLTGNKSFAALAVLFVICFGALAGGQGMIWLILKPDVRFLGFPFLRRFEPGVPFPLCFVFFTLVWKSFNATSRRAALLFAVFAGLTFATLVFSYFYLWTTCLAWFVAITALWLWMRRDSQVLRKVLVVSVPSLIALTLFGYFISKLPAAVNQAQVLTFTRGLDLFRIPEIVGAVVLVVLFLAIRKGRVSLKDPIVVFATSFLVLPFLVFNQQIVSGRSIQPFHYEVLIVNYVVLVGLALVVKLLHPPMKRRTVWLVVVLCICWASVELIFPAPIRSANDQRLDQMVPVLKRLNALATEDGTWEALRTTGQSRSLVFSPDYGISRLLPTWAPQGLLIGTGTASFQGLTEHERKEWIHLHLYYSGRDESFLRELLNDRVDDPFLTYFLKSTMFGPERVLLFLGWNSKPVTQPEIEEEVREYSAFTHSFTKDTALKRPIKYVITRNDVSADLTRVDRWYERDQGETWKDYTLFRVKIR